MFGIVKLTSAQNNGNKSYSDVNKLLERENKERNAKWSKLIISKKQQKLYAFIEKKGDYTDLQKKQLKIYVRNCFNRKKLLKDKDVDYNIETGEVEKIHNLNYNEQTKKFTLTNKSLNITIKNTKKHIEK